MSVVGFDVGNDASCVALARKRGIDVLMNKESKRETPTVVNFGEKMRFLGTDGAAKASLSPQNTITEIKRLIGKRFSDPAVQADIKKMLFKVTEGPDGGCLVHVMYCNEQHTFTPEQLMAMVLVDLKKIAEMEAGITVTDCTISVPVFFTQAERYAVLNAASIAGVNCLRLLNENTATALAYGIYKTDLPDTEPVHVMFVDVGHSATQVSVVAFKKSGMHVKSHAWDRNLGGRDLDELLFEHFVAQFKETYKIDIKTNKKASYKLRMQCEKVKKMLSANSEAPLNVECIMEDKDVRGMMTRETLEKLAAPFLERLRVPIEQAIAESGVSFAELGSVEIIGSSTRVPSIAAVVEQVTGRVPSRTMNSKECVSRGCALQCAMLSPVFKVREFDVIDAVPYAIDFRWDKDGEPTSQRLYDKNSAFPSTKMLTFKRGAPFSVTAHTALPEGGGQLGEYTVGPFELPPGADKATVKVKVSMNLHGIVAAEAAYCEVEAEAAPSGEAKMETDAAAANGEASAAPEATPEAGPAPMDTDAAAAAAGGAKAEQPAAAKKKVKKQEVPVKAAMEAGMGPKAVEGFFELEAQMQVADRLQEETNEKKNALEAYVYELRNKLYEASQYGQYVKDAEKESLLAELQRMEDWLYDEGEDVMKSVYVTQLEELKKKSAGVEQRAHEDQARAPAVAALQASLQQYLGVGRSEAPQFAHLTAEERGTLLKECEAAEKWLAEKQAMQSALSKHDPPCLLAADVLKKRDTLERVCAPIAAKPVPKPATPPKPAAEAAPEAAKEGEPMESDEPAGGAAAEGAPMEQ